MTTAKQRRKILKKEFKENYQTIRISEELRNKIIESYEDALAQKEIVRAHLGTTSCDKFYGKFGTISELYPDAPANVSRLLTTVEQIDSSIRALLLSRDAIEKGYKVEEKHDLKLNKTTYTFHKKKK